MSSSSSPPPCELAGSVDGSAAADSPVAGEGAAGVSAGGVATAPVVVAESLLAVGAGVGTGAAAGAAAGAGAGVGAGTWKAGVPPLISLRRKFAASASFLSHAKYACLREEREGINNYWCGHKEAQQTLRDMHTFAVRRYRDAANGMNSTASTKNVNGLPLVKKKLQSTPPRDLPDRKIKEVLTAHQLVAAAVSISRLALGSV